MVLKHCVVARLLLAVVCLFSAVNTYAAGEITYDPSTTSSGCSVTNKYKALSASSTKVLKITCPDTTSADFPALKYEPPSLSWCGAYEKIVVENNKAVTITCSPLFSIAPEKSSVTLNKPLALTVTRTVEVASKLELALTLSTGSGHFTDVDGKTDYGSSHSGSMEPNQSTKTIYVMLTALGPATVTASAPGSAPVANVVVTGVTNVVCPAPQNSPVERDIGGLSSVPYADVVPFSPANKYWEIQKGEAFAIKFKLGATLSLTRYFYVFKFYETTGYPLSAMELAIHPCPGVWEEMTPYCSIKQVIGNEAFNLYASDKKSNFNVCHVEPGKEYYLNIRDTARNGPNDPYKVIKFLLALDIS